MNEPGRITVAGLDVLGELHAAGGDLSRNGVFVNGVRVKGSQSLHNGDIVRLGTEELRFEAERRSTE